MPDKRHWHGRSSDVRVLCGIKRKNQKESSCHYADALEIGAFVGIRRSRCCVRRGTSQKHRAARRFFSIEEVQRILGAARSHIERSSGWPWKRVCVPVNCAAFERLILILSVVSEHQQSVCVESFNPQKVKTPLDVSRFRLVCLSILPTLFVGLSPIKRDCFSPPATELPGTQICW